MSDSYFKYKPIYLDQNENLEERTIDHVLKPIVNSYYYLPTRKQLNDPTEGTFDNQIQKDIAGFLQGLIGIGERIEITRSIQDLARQIGRSTDNSGVFSLSRNAIDELMWAHYANSHCGLTIEYDISLLTRFSATQHLHRFDVRYRKEPPTLKLENIQKNIPEAIRAMLGNKSPTWSHEEEHRVLLENISGLVPHDYRAVKSVTFGVNVSNNIRDYIYDRTKDKVPEYYEIEIEPNSYSYKRRHLSEYEGNSPTGTPQDVEWEQHLEGIEGGRKEELKEKMIREIEQDPHFKELLLADRSTVDRSRAVLQYESQHDIPLKPWSKYTKVHYLL
ncbi:MAG: DUF2971 domain-containing protein [Candidatus Thiodiazotropha sp. (ex Monitilora ramsayi)]|nr:DUF2971 domain-containing protein [Candidatus Thiodiazotropha sp. (ex Monitilora ramsayi)]